MRSRHRGPWDTGGLGKSRQSRGRRTSPQPWVWLGMKLRYTHIDPLTFSVRWIWLRTYEKMTLRVLIVYCESIHPLPVCQGAREFRNTAVQG